MRFSNCLAILALVSQGLCTVKYIKHSDQTYAWMEEIDNAPTPSRDSMKAANEKEYHHMVSDAVEENSMAPNAMAALYVWTTNNPSTRKGVLIHYSSIKMGDGKGAKASVATEEFTNSCGLSPGHTKWGNCAEMAAMAYAHSKGYILKGGYITVFGIQGGVAKSMEPCKGDDTYWGCSQFCEKVDVTPFLKSRNEARYQSTFVELE